MSLSPELLTLAHYLAGEFDNKAQAQAEPVWYVHLRLWHRPIPAHLFSEDSLVLMAEQANGVTLNQPYRQRIMRLQSVETESGPKLQVQYYQFKDPSAFQGAGSKPEKLTQLQAKHLEFLPGCMLTVSWKALDFGGYHFQAILPEGAKCCFSYQNKIRQVSLGFEATPAQFLSYDKGIDSVTGKALWGAILGPFQFTKCQDFSAELPV